MKNPLFDWLDQVEGKEPGTTTDAINAERERQGYEPKK